MIRSEGCKSGLVFNPATPLSVLQHVIDKVDMILLMSVNPGFGGQSFLPSTLERRHCRRISTRLIPGLSHASEIMKRIFFSGYWRVRLLKGRSAWGYASNFCYDDACFAWSISTGLNNPTQPVTFLLDPEDKFRVALIGRQRDVC